MCILVDAAVFSTGAGIFRFITTLFAKFYQELSFDEEWTSYQRKKKKQNEASPPPQPTTLASPITTLPSLNSFPTPTTTLLSVVATLPTNSLHTTPVDDFYEPPSENSSFDSSGNELPQMVKSVYLVSWFVRCC